MQYVPRWEDAYSPNCDAEIYSQKEEFPNSNYFSILFILIIMPEGDSPQIDCSDFCNKPPWSRLPEIKVGLGVFLGETVIVGADPLS